jgi:hypothetical protein
MVVIDHVSGLKIDESLFNNEISTLNSLAAGLYQLFLQVRSFEVPIQAYEKEKRVQVLSFGFYNFSRFGLPADIEVLLPCYFHWFGVTVCNYVRLAGFLDGAMRGVIRRDELTTTEGRKLVKHHCDQYLATVQEISNVRYWRNKVYAHFAITDPRNGDTASILDLSVMSPVIFGGGRFRAGGGLIFTRRDEDGEMPDWSLTETFESLANQFWPGLTRVD